MEQTQESTWQERTVVRVLGPDGKPFEYNLAQVGPTSWFSLADAEYGEGFQRPTVSQLVPLVSAAALPQNRDNENPRKVLGRWLAGNSLVVLGREGLYGVDFPQVQDGRILLDEATLKSRLGKRQDRKMVLSDDGLVRFTPYGFEAGNMDSGKLAVNSGVAVAYGGFKNADLFAQTASHYRMKPYFGCANQAPEKPEIKVPDVCALDDLDNRLYVNCNNDPSDDDWSSFGVRSSASDSAESRSAAKK